MGRFFAKSGVRDLRGLGRRAAARLARTIGFYRSGAPRNERLLTLVVFLLGIVIATGAFFAIQYHYRTKAQKAFENAARAHPERFEALLQEGR